MKKISVITPVFNRQEFVQECVSSVASINSQQLFELEHIIVDDDSTDGTRQYLERLKETHVKKIYLESHSGPAKARNMGIKNSEADYIFFLDSDDLLVQNGLRYLFAEAQRSQARWLYGDSLTIGESLNYIIGKDYHGTQFADPADLLVSMYTKKHIFQTNSLYDRKALLGISGYDESLQDGENAEMAVRLILSKNMPQYVATTVTLRRVHQSNLSLTNILMPEGRIKDLLASFRKHKEALRQFLPAEKYTEIASFMDKHG